MCNGAVTKEIGSKLVKICTDGKIKTKTRKIVGEGYPLVDRDTGPGMDCTWYGTVFCDGDVVEVRTIKLHLSMMIIFSLLIFPGSPQVVVQDEVFQGQIFSC